MMQVGEKEYKVSFLDTSLCVKGENHYQVAYTIAIILLRMKKLSTLSSGVSAYIC